MICKRTCAGFEGEGRDALVMKRIAESRWTLNSVSDSGMRMQLDQACELLDPACPAQ